MLPVKCLLFDIDGTLIDSNDAHAKAWELTLRESGFEVPYDKIRTRIGMGGDHLLPELTLIEADSKEGKKLEESRGSLFRKEFLPKLEAFARSREVLETLKAKDFKIVAATSASEKDLAALLKQTGLENIFDEETNSSDVERSKPDPDIIHAAIKKSGVSALNTLMIGDTPYDIEAARKANVKTIALTCGGWSEKALLAAGAWKVYPSPTELLHAIKNGSAFL